MNNDFENHTGYIYFLDANSNRQYSLWMENGTAVPPVNVHEEDAARGKAEQDVTLPANRFFFAYSEPVYEVKDNTLFAHTTAFQFKTDEHGKRIAGATYTRYAPVVFQVKTYAAVQNGVQKIMLEPELTNDSIQELRDADFNINVPVTFESFLSQEDFNEIANAQAWSKLPLFPHHPDGAKTARAQTAKMQPPALPQKTQKKAQQDTGVARRNPRYTEPRDPQHDTRTIETMLSKFGTDLMQKSRDGRIDPVIGRDDEIRQAVQIMSSREKANVCFVGEPGTGKTAMFGAVADYIAKGKNVPEILQNARIIQIDFQQMVAGTKYRGQFEERVMPLLNGLKERNGYLNGQKVILVFDELHLQLATGGGTDGGTSVGQVLKPYLAEQGTITMSATTLDEYKKYIEKDGALERRFSPCIIDPTNHEATKAVVAKKWPLLKQHHGLDTDLSDAQIEKIVTLSTRYAPDRYQPDKASYVTDFACSTAAVRGSRKVEESDINAAIANLAKLPETFLSQSEDERYLHMARELPQQVLGQDHALEEIINSLMGARAGLGDDKKPMGAFLLQGPTGTGKTETARALARLLFGTEDALIRIDMAEFQEKHSISRLIGAAPGYVGYDDSQAMLTEEVRRRPYSILLVDEIEKGHPDVMNLFLRILDEGSMKDNKGKVALYNNTLIIFTTNLGAAEAANVLRGSNDSLGFSMGTPAQAETDRNNKVTDIYKKAVQSKLPPELIGRLDLNGGIITYNPLSRDTVTQLLRRQFEKVSEKLSTPGAGGYNGVSLVLSPEAEAILAKEGYKPESGARPVQGVVRKRVINPLSHWILENREQLADFVAKNGGAKIYVADIDNFAPVLQKPDAAHSNDNAQKAPVAKKARKVQNTR